MTAEKACESCGMPIDAAQQGRYCQHCVDEEGHLQAFPVRFASMVEWQLGRNPGLTQDEAEAQTRVYMSGMPAWRDHPEVAGSTASW